MDLKVLDVKVKDGEDSYTLTHAWRENGLLTTPPPASHVVPRESLAQLRKSFGYRNTDYHSLGRVVADAFGGPEVRYNDTERSKIGRAILKDFETPSLPFFLLDLCRYYARNLRNWPKETWPVWMRLPD